MSSDPFINRLKRQLYLADGDKYDHRHDPRDVTGHMEADPELARQMQRLGLVARWSIDNRWRLTDKGVREMERRKEAARVARLQGAVKPFAEQRKDHMATEANSSTPTEEELRLRSPTLRKHEHGNDS